MSINNPAEMADKLLGAVIGLVRAIDAGTDVDADSYKLLIQSLVLVNTRFGDNEKFERQIEKIHAEKRRLVPDCAVCASPCGRTADYDVGLMWAGDETVCALKTLILGSLQSLAVYACLGLEEGRTDDEINRFLCEAMFLIGYDCGIDELLPIAMRMGDMTKKARALFE